MLATEPVGDFLQKLRDEWSLAARLGRFNDGEANE